MSRVNYSLVIVILLVLFMSPFSSPGVLDNPLILQPNAFTSGIINGVSYSYGTNTYFASGNASRIDDGAIFEQTNSSTVSVENATLIMGFNSTPMEAYYQVRILRQTSLRNQTSEFWVNMDGLDTWVTQEIFNNTVLRLSTNFPSANITELLAWNVTADYSVQESIIVDQYGSYLSTYETTTTYFEYHDAFLGQLVHVSGIIYTKVIFFEVLYEVHEVEVTRSTFTYGWMAYVNIFSRAYNISATAHQVNITDGENFAVAFNMFDSISANYTESQISFMSYDFRAVEVASLKFSNGTDVNPANYPFSMYARTYQVNGSRIEAGYNQVESKILSTYQNVLSAFATVDTEEGDNNFSLSARLAIWGISTSTTLVAYKDINNNDRLDVSLRDSGLQVTNDYVTHIGLAEAYQTKVFRAYYSSHNQTTVIQGFGIDINETEYTEPEFYFTYDEFGFGNVEAAVSSDFVWNEPSVQDNEVVFDFGVSYENYPVTWVNLADGSVVEDSEDISYFYKVFVNPTTGKAKISTTWNYGGITDADLADQMQGTSLSLMVKSEFFAVQALYTATANNDSISSTTSTSVSKIGFKVGDSNATEIDVTGSKQFYMLDGSTNETATFDALNLVTVAGVFSEERTSPFDSESEATGGTASLSVTERLDVSFFYSANLLIINYPEWNGNSLVHDPDYSVNYHVEDEPTSTEDTSTSTGSTSTDPTTTESSYTDDTSDSTSDDEETSTTDDTTIKTTAAQNDTTPVPGFELFMISSVVILLIIRRKSRN
ncbi:MAG: hypothetical protein INQ03_16300 [Candidatus Heimdallarchaeota archaeon]|nr:hypothetical protein [Candidatus Heimdallarchaeota archaeon]